MELTQRLECTQHLSEYTNDCEKVYPEQIGFLGICGTKYPLKKGPNKIGRDPETCNIVLNLNSISRQHAVINILNNRDFMLMDLDSANKTKLSNKILQPYIPHPLKNGDMVQFGDAFGVFRLLQEDNDLPMTQAMDVVDTPVQNRHVSKLNIHATTIPESPEVSDKDDSFIVSSQQKPKGVFKSPNNNFLKSSGKTISIRPIGSNKIDNVYWSSSKKSDSFSMQSNISGNLDDSVTSPRNSRVNVNKQNIHEIDTQIPYVIDNIIKPIHELDTQVQYADIDNSLHSIYNANTQIVESSDTPNIYEMEAQVLTLENLPEVCKIQEQENRQINFTTENKENVNNIYNAETQIPINAKPESPVDMIHNAETQIALTVKSISPRVNGNENIKSNLSTSSRVSDDIILFDEIDNEPVQDDFESQQLLSPNLNVNDQAGFSENNSESYDIKFLPQKRANRIESGSSTDCEDINIVATKVIPEIKNDDDLTDCEDELNATQKGDKNRRESSDINEDVTDFEDNLNDNDIILPNRVLENIEDLPTQVLDCAKVDEKMAINDDCFEDLPTQILDCTKIDEKMPINDDCFEDLATPIIIDESKSIQIQKSLSNIATQVLEPQPQKGTCFAEALTQQIYSEEVVQFKVPFQSPVKKQKKIAPKENLTKSSTVIEIIDDDDEKYYAATQELFNDLCSQRVLSPETKVVQNYNIHHSPKKQSSIVNTLNRSDSSGSIDPEEKINDFVFNLTCSQIQDVVGVPEDVTVLKKVPSNGSDFLATPKKINCLSVLETDIPNTQEIKARSILIASSDTESGSHSESDINSEKSTPIKMEHRKKVTNKIRINLSNKFDPKNVFLRSSTRTRKPTSKLQNCDDIAIKIIETSKVLDIKVNGLSSKENNDKHRSTDLGESDESYNSARRSYRTNRNTSPKIETEKPKKNERKRDKKAKQKDDTIDNVKLNVNETETININSGGRRTRSKNKEKLQERMKEKDESYSSNKKSQNLEKIQARPDVRNKSKKKSSKDRSKSPKIEKAMTEKRSVSPELQTRNKTKEMSKLLENKKRPAKERTRSLDNEKEKKSIREFSTNKESKSPEKGNQKKAKENKKKIVESEESGVRRSKRYRVKKSEEKNDMKLSKDEYSRVYSTMSMSLTDTSNDSINKSAKRPASCAIERPGAKKRRRNVGDHNLIQRATPAKKIETQYVLFTAFACEEVKNKLEQLGAVIVSDVLSCTVVLTLQIKRTFKLLCAVGLGKPIVGPNWVQACADTNMIVDPWLYLLNDEATEKRFKFKLQQTLAGKRDFLKGFNVSSTPKVMPNESEMKLIVECSGGTWKGEGPNWVCVSTPADRALWPALRQRGAVIVSTEFILGGVLTQTPDIGRNKL